MKSLLDSIHQRRAPGPGAGEELSARIAALAKAVEIGTDRVPDTALAPARGVLEHAAKRLEHSTEHTVVALAGSTGSGKSSLFNRLAGHDLSTVGVRRPTTAQAQACVWGKEEGAGSLLDWLGISRRHVLPAGERHPLAGLVLLDLPDHDSTQLAHRLEVDRLVTMVDLMVWVTDPQKYADAVLHRRYLAPLAQHGSVLIFALNHADELPDPQRDACLRDLTRLLADDGFNRPTILATSAATGIGIDRLTALLGQRVKRTQAATSRLAADVDRAATRLAGQVGESPIGVPERPSPGLITAMSQAAGVPAVVDAVASSHERQAISQVGFPLTKWLGKLRPDPLRRLHLGDRSGSAAPRSGSGSELEALVTARTSLPEPSPAQRARIDSALREEVRAGAQGLTGTWREAVVRAGRSNAEQLPDELDRAIGSTTLPGRQAPRWWSVLAMLQWLLLIIAVVGGLWLVLLGVFGWLQIDASAPSVIGLPLPTILLIGGILVGLLVAGIGRRAARVAGRRRGAQARRALTAAVTDVAQRLVVDPMAVELRHCVEFTDAVAAARPG